METAGRVDGTGGVSRFRQPRSMATWQPRRKAPDAAKSASSAWSPSAKGDEEERCTSASKPTSDIMAPSGEEALR
jgi:hypothetical protein